MRSPSPICRSLSCRSPDASRSTRRPSRARGTPAGATSITVRHVPGAHLVGCGRHPETPTARVPGAEANIARDPNPPAHRPSTRHGPAVAWRPPGRRTSSWRRWPTSPCCAPPRAWSRTIRSSTSTPTRPASCRRSVSMWNPDVSMGTVIAPVHRLPAPHGAVLRASWTLLGVPTWVAQRLWTGSLLFLAGAGVLFLLRTLSPGSRDDRGTGSLDMATMGGVGAMVAALAYMLSPYVLQNEARQSALLLPWVGLPWMVGLAARALRTGRMAARGALRSRGGPGGQHQRRGSDPRRRGARAVGGVGARRRPGADGAGPCRRRSRSACSSAAVSLWWVVGPGRRGRLRHGHLALHRVDPDGGPDQPRRRRPCGGSATGSSTASTSWASTCRWRGRT